MPDDAVEEAPANQVGSLGFQALHGKGPGHFVLKKMSFFIIRKAFVGLGLKQLGPGLFMR